VKAQGGDEERRMQAATAAIMAAESDGTPDPDLLTQPYTDTGNAERLVELHGRDIRFCPETKKWLMWDSFRWNSQDTRRVKVLAKRTIRLMYAQAAGIEDADIKEKAERHARKSESAAGIAALLSCAEYEDGILISASELDRNPYLLNFLNGTLDLRSNELRGHWGGPLG